MARFAINAARTDLQFLWWLAARVPSRGFIPPTSSKILKLRLWITKQRPKTTERPIRQSADRFVLPLLLGDCTSGQSILSICGSRFVFRVFFFDSFADEIRNRGERLATRFCLKKLMTIECSRSSDSHAIMVQSRTIIWQCLDNDLS